MIIIFVTNNAFLLWRKKKWVPKFSGEYFASTYSYTFKYCVCCVCCVFAGVYKFTMCDLVLLYHRFSVFRVEIHEIVFTKKRVNLLSIRQNVWPYWTELNISFNYLLFTCGNIWNVWIQKETYQYNNRQVAWKQKTCTVVYICVYYWQNILMDRIGVEYSLMQFYIHCTVTTIGSIACCQ